MSTTHEITLVSNNDLAIAATIANIWCDYLQRKSPQKVNVIGKAEIDLSIEMMKNALASKINISKDEIESFRCALILEMLDKKYFNTNVDYHPGSVLSHALANSFGTKDISDIFPYKSGASLSYENPNIIKTHGLDIASEILLHDVDCVLLKKSLIAFLEKRNEEAQTFQTLEFNDSVLMEVEHPIQLKPLFNEVIYASFEQNEFRTRFYRLGDEIQIYAGGAQGIDAFFKAGRCGITDRAIKDYGKLHVRLATQEEREAFLDALNAHEQSN